MSTKKFLVRGDDANYWVNLSHQNTHLQVLLILPSGQAYRGHSQQCEHRVFLSMSEDNSSVALATQVTSLIFHGSTLPNTECALEINCNTINNRFEFLLWCNAQQDNKIRDLENRVRDLEANAIRYGGSIGLQSNRYPDFVVDVSRSEGNKNGGTIQTWTRSASHNPGQRFTVLQ